MRISDYYVEYFKSMGVKYVFGLTGSGTALQFFDSLAQTDGIDYVCTLHEQAAGMAADAYSCSNHTIGVCVVDSGPGASNLMTPVCGSFYNSHPVIYIIGQPQRTFIRNAHNMRHFGYHELDISVFAPVSKYVTQINDPNDARYELEKAVYLATSGRPGPVVIALPDDVTWLDIEPETLRRFEVPGKQDVSHDAISEVLAHVLSAERPVLLLGNGIKCARCEDKALRLIDALSCPVALTYATRDLLPDDHRLNIGSFGIQGSRSGNFTVQNADMILSIGARFDPSETGWPASNFARAATVISVDVDPAELEKYKDFGISCHFPICMDAENFVDYLFRELEEEKVKLPVWTNWIDQVRSWRNKYPICLDEYYKESSLNPYVFVKELSECADASDTLVTDTSTSRNYFFQSFKFKQGQQAISWLNFACLGYGLPAAVGASFAPGARVIAIMGDGALQFNIQELATVMFHQLNIKIFVFENGGYGGICHTQDNFLGGRHYASVPEYGLPLPVSSDIARAYGFPVYEIHNNREAGSIIKQVLEREGPVYCSVKVSLDRWSTPVKSGKRPIEDLAPLLPRDEFCEQMIIPPVN